MYFHFLSFLLGGIIQILLPFASNFFWLCVEILLMGVVDGLFLSFIVPIALDVTESHALSNHAIGYFFTCTALPVSKFIQISIKTVLEIMLAHYIFF